jgi:hypothetical protein
MVGAFHFVRRVSQVIRVKGRRTVRNAVLGITDSTGWSCWPVTGKNLIWGENTGLLRYFTESSAA